MSGDPPVKTDYQRARDLNRDSPDLTGPVETDRSQTPGDGSVRDHAQSGQNEDTGRKWTREVEETGGVLSSHTKDSRQPITLLRLVSS